MTARPPDPPRGDLRAAPVRLIPRRSRGPAVALGLLGAGLTGALGACTALAGHVDRRVADRVDLRRGAAGTLAQHVADLAGLGPVSLASAVAAVPARRRHGARGPALALLGPVLARVTTSLVLKPIAGRTKRGRLVYPSGHTTSVAALAVAVGVLVLGADHRSRRVRAVLVVGLAVPVVAVGVALVGRGYHRATDTVGAVGVALAVVLALALVLDAGDPGPRAAAVLPS